MFALIKDSNSNLKKTKKKKISALLFCVGLKLSNEETKLVFIKISLFCSLILQPLDQVLPRRCHFVLLFRIRPLTK